MFVSKFLYCISEQPKMNNSLVAFTGEDIAYGAYNQKDSWTYLANLIQNNYIALE